MATVRLGILGEELSGSAGNTTFVRTPYGTVVRNRTTPRNPRTPAQTAARRCVARAGEAWLNLTLEQADAWREYADALAAAQGEVGSPLYNRVQTVFSKLAIKYLQVHPDSSVPPWPPTGAFYGDRIQVQCTAGAPGSSELVFSASAPSGAGIFVEMLAQPLASPHRKAFSRNYRSQGFVEFTADQLSHTAPVKAGWYATAYRFVEAATGRATDLTQLPRLRVEA